MATLSSLEPAMKQMYKDQYVETVVLKHNPLLGILKKDENFRGKNMPLVLQYADVAGGSANFTKAKANATDSAWEDFLLTRVKRYQFANVDGETAEASEEKAGSFVKAMSHEINSALRSLANQIETQLPLNGNGTIGQISAGSTVTTDTITLTDPHNIYRFEVGMTLTASATDGGSVRTGTEKIGGINRRTGELVATSAAWDTVITAIDAGDYLQQDGDALNGGSTKLCISGFAGWFPETAPGGSDSWFNVNRSVDSRLYGSYHDGSGQKISDALIDGQSTAGTEEGAPNVAVMHHVQYRRLIKELGSQKEYSETAAQGGKGMIANIGYKGIKVVGIYGDMTVLASNKVQSDIAWLLQTDTCVFASIGKAPKIDMLDGNKILRRADDDGVEVRTKFYGNFGSDAPVYNCHTKLKAA